MDIWGCNSKRACLYIVLGTRWNGEGEKKVFFNCVCFQELPAFYAKGQQSPPETEIDNSISDFNNGPTIPSSLCTNFMCCYSGDLCDGYNPNRFVFNTSDVFSGSDCPRCRAITAGGDYEIDDPYPCEVISATDSCDPVFESFCAPNNTSPTSRVTVNSHEILFRMYYQRLRWKVFWQVLRKFVYMRMRMYFKRNSLF